MILASQETYDMFFNAFGRDSFDGAGAIMDSIFNRGDGCPNASWNGVVHLVLPGHHDRRRDRARVGPRLHAVHDGLIYAWQPGALNEPSSDIFGETVDRINGRGDGHAGQPARRGRMLACHCAAA